MWGGRAKANRLSQLWGRECSASRIRSGKTDGLEAPPRHLRRNLGLFRRKVEAKQPGSRSATPSMHRQFPRTAAAPRGVLSGGHAQETRAPRKSAKQFRARDGIDAILRAHGGLKLERTCYADVLEKDFTRSTERSNEECDEVFLNHGRSLPRARGPGSILGRDEKF